MRSLATADAAVQGDASIECIASSATRRGGEGDRWSDPTIYSLPVKRLPVGTSSIVLSDGAVDVEEFVAVDLGGMAGEPGILTSHSRAVSTLRIINRSTKAWPAGEMLVMNDGRLEARGTLEELLATCPEMRRLWQGENAG